jgi:hypothetical protein
MMVARIAPQPVSTNLAVAEYRARSRFADSRPPSPLQDDPLPPVPAPVPTPVPTPAVQTTSEAFAAALVVAQLGEQPSNIDELRLRLSGDWQAPVSPLRLADRQV